MGEGDGRGSGLGLGLGDAWKSDIVGIDLTLASRGLHDPGLAPGRTPDGPPLTRLAPFNPLPPIGVPRALEPALRGV